MYKTLRPILDKCVEKWRKPFWTKVPIGDFDRFVLFHHEVAFMWERYSYNDLFSKQSWIIDVVELDIKDELYILVYQKWWFIETIKSKNDIAYMIMWPMTKEEKIQYFINNIVI